MEDISLVEARSILIVYDKLEYGNFRDIDRVCEYLEESGRFESAGARRFLEELKDYRQTEIPGYICPICDSTLEEDDRFICKSCRDALQAKLDVAEDEKKRLNKILIGRKTDKKTTEPEPSVKDKVLKALDKGWKTFRAWFKVNVADRMALLWQRLLPTLRKPITWVITGISVALLAAVIVIICLVSNSKDVAGKVYEDFREQISPEGYFMGNMTMPESGVTQYDIMPTYEALLIFTDEDDELVGAALNMMGSDDVSRTRQATFIKALNMAMYDDITELDATNLVSLISYNKGLLEFRGYQCILAFTDDSAYYYMINTDKMDPSAVEALNELGVTGNVIDGSENGTDAADSEPVDIADDLDGLSLIGQDFTLCSELFGEGSQVVGDNTLYYSSVGVSIIYDKESGQVVYMDCDGTGSSGSIPVAGVSVGDSLNEVEQELNQIGAEVTELPGDDTTKVYVDYNGHDIDVEISMKDDVVILVCATLNSGE